MRILPAVFAALLTVSTSGKPLNHVTSLEEMTSLNEMTSLKTPEYKVELAKFALEFAAASYSEDPIPCTSKNNATLIYRIALPCDYWNNECWGIVALTDEWIVVAFRGTTTKLQLITELVETMSEPKKKLKAGGSVQHYFYVALQSIWKTIASTLKKLKTTYPDHKILFTGHSLGGALASLASTVFAHHHPGIRNRIHLFTFGQPRVGNYEYAQAHDMLVPRSWRIVHKYDLVAHLPACAIKLISRSCFPFFNHAPYHHGVEIWYPSNMTENSVYSVCGGTPLDEDDSCSNGWYLHYRIKDHIFYFEHDVSAYGYNGCVDPPVARVEY